MTPPAPSAQLLRIAGARLDTRTSSQEAFKDANHMHAHGSILAHVLNFGPNSMWQSQNCISLYWPHRHLEGQEVLDNAG